MRLRTLTEAECYARCYGSSHEERIVVLPAARPRNSSRDGDALRARFEARLDARGPEAEAA
jgi:hypothetical protein